jgi:hypothetical protein
VKLAGRHGQSPEHGEWLEFILGSGSYHGISKVHEGVPHGGNQVGPNSGLIRASFLLPKSWFLDPGTSESTLPRPRGKASMKVSSSLVAAVTIAVSTALSIAPQHLARDDASADLTESPELADLLQTAKSNVIDQVTAEERKRGAPPPGCTSDKLVFRRE